MIREFSAGGVCVRQMRGRHFMAAVRVKDGAVLALPKGHIDPGESAAPGASWPTSSAGGSCSAAAVTRMPWNGARSGAPRDPSPTRTSTLS